MKSMLAVSITLAAMLAGPCAAMNLIPESLVVARDDTTAYTYEGCFKSAGNLKLNGTNTWQSKKTCHDLCVPLAASVEATANTNECWCGNALPATADKVDDSQCNANCTGYPLEMCGSASTFSVYLTGVGTVSNSSTSSSAAPSSSSTTSASPSVVTVEGNGQTVVVTTGPTNSPTSHSSTNKAAIAAGVVVGLVVFAAAVAGGAFLFIRRRRNRQVEEEYRRNAAVSEFVAGGKTHNSDNASYSSYSDNRLDPSVMAQRRMSDGSIADNQDYSRRILKVTNA